MRQVLGLLLLLTVLAACGDASDSDDRRAGGSPTPDDAGAVRQVALVSATAAGGAVDPAATRLPDAAAVRAYAARFTGDDLAARIEQAAAEADVPADRELAAGVVAVGCEVATSVTGRVEGERVELTAVVPSSDKECYAPVTTVALVLVPR